MPPAWAEGYTTHKKGKTHKLCWCCDSRFKVKYGQLHDDVSVSKLFNLQLSNEQECEIKEPRAGSINKVTNYPRLRSEYCCDKFYLTGDNREKSSPVKTINLHKRWKLNTLKYNKIQNKNVLFNFGFWLYFPPLTSLRLNFGKLLTRSDSCMLFALHFGGGSSVNRNKM